MYVDMVYSYIDVVTLYVESQLWNVNTSFWRVDTVIVMCRHTRHMCRRVFISSSTCWTCLLTTVSTHLLSESTSLGIQQLTVSTHITYVSIFFNVFFTLCRCIMNMCQDSLIARRPIFKCSVQCVDVPYMRVDLSSSYTLNVSTFHIYVSTWLRIFCFECQPVIEIFDLWILSLWPVKYSSSIKI